MHCLAMLREKLANVMNVSPYATRMIRGRGIFAADDEMFHTVLMGA
jgi:hypothetical protein